MPLTEPTFDSRTYRELLNEALARIPAHNPEWTNRSDSDPGVTLLQLFAFMTESIIYRANLIPQRNRQKFLRLLGIPMQPAAPAHGLVTFQNPRGEFRTFTLEKDEELLVGNVPIRTEKGLDVLPIEARLYYKRPLTDAQIAELGDLYRRLYMAYDLPDTELDFYETTVFEPAASGVTLRSLDISKQTKDGALWVALLARANEDPQDAREKIARKTLSLGILPALDESGCVLYPLGPSVRQQQPTLIFEIPNAIDDRIRYEPLEPDSDHDPLAKPGIVKLTLPEVDKLKVWEGGPLTAGVGNRPPSLEETDDLKRLITWIRIRSPQIDISAKASSRQLSIVLSWVGINAVPAVQHTKIAAEVLPLGTGQPDQIMRLTNTPVVEGSLQLTINGEIWQEIDDLVAAPPEVRVRSPRFASESPKPGTGDGGSSKVYALDLESGEIRFGDGARGMRPPAGASILAAYDYGGGRQGLVAIGTINKGPRLPSGIKVTNPVPTWGGSQAETVEEAERRIPQFISHRDRLVSQKDCEDITWRTPGVDLGRVEVLPLHHPKLARQTSEGVVTILVIPKTDPVQPGAPQPDSLFLETVCAYLSPRRILTTELHVKGPVYKELWVAVGIDVVPGHDPGPVREKVKEEVNRFLSPLIGGFEGRGWPLNTVVDGLEVAAAVTRVEGVAKVNLLRLGTSDGAEVPEVAMEGLELPYLRKVVVVEGDPPTLEEIRGDLEPPADGEGVLGQNVVPVPIVPQEC